MQIQQSTFKFIYIFFFVSSNLNYHPNKIQESQKIYVFFFVVVVCQRFSPLDGIVFFARWMLNPQLAL